MVTVSTQPPGTTVPLLTCARCGKLKQRSGEFCSRCDYVAARTLSETKGERLKATRSCAGCKASYPATFLHFGFDKTADDRLRARCLTCEQALPETALTDEPLLQEGRFRLDKTGNVLAKQCPRCEQWKQAEGFHPHKTNKFGLQSWCKQCANGHTKATTPAPAQQRSDAIWQVEGEHVVGRRCADCGVTKPLEDFIKQTAKPHGVRSYCKDCFPAHRPSARADEPCESRAEQPGDEQPVLPSLVAVEPVPSQPALPDYVPPPPFRTPLPAAADIMLQSLSPGHSFWKLLFRRKE